MSSRKPPSKVVGLLVGEVDKPVAIIDLDVQEFERDEAGKWALGSPLVQDTPLFFGYGTGTNSVLLITVVKPFNISMKLEASNGIVPSCLRCSAFCQADSREALTFQAAIVSSR